MRSHDPVVVVFAKDHVARPAVAVALWALISILCAPASLAASQVTAGTRACSTHGTAAASTSVCRIMPASGTFSLPIPGTGAALIGIGTPDRAGKEIVLTRAPLVCRSLGGIGIRITTPRSTGLLPPLHWTNGTLYFRDAATGQCKGVASPALAAAPGVYQVVPAAGIVRMPATGGAANDRPSQRWPLAVFGLLLLALGAARTVRSYRLRS